MDEHRRAFDAAYDALLARWPSPVEAVDIPTGYGTTRIHACGPTDAPALLLLPGSGATSMAWFAVATVLSAHQRCYAVDPLTDVGRSIPAGQSLRQPADVVAWLDALLVNLELTHVNLCGHSYGGWTALWYALHRPQRVRRLALVDPTQCFAGLAAGYLLRAAPLLAGPSARRMRALVQWESAGGTIDPAWLELLARGVEVNGNRVVRPRRPPAAQLRTNSVPTLILLAGASRAHNIRRVADVVEREMAHVDTNPLPDVSHHMLPTERADQLARSLRAFLA